MTATRFRAASLLPAAAVSGTTTVHRGNTETTATATAATRVTVIVIATTTAATAMDEVTAEAVVAVVEVVAGEDMTIGIGEDGMEEGVGTIVIAMRSGEAVVDGRGRGTGIGIGCWTGARLRRDGGGVRRSVRGVWCLRRTGRRSSRRVSLAGMGGERQRQRRWER